MEINLSGKIDDYAIGLLPRCSPHLRRKAAEVLSATGYLKPCCYYSTSEEFQDLIEFFNERGIDAKADLDISKSTIPEIKQSATWRAIEEGLYTGNLPKICFMKCSSDESLPSSVAAQNWEIYNGKR